MSPHQPDPIDVFVGVRLRGRRHELKLSQGALADRLGISFQQIQKYERGANRISASMMVHAAKALDVPPAYFFEGLPDVTAERGGPDLLKAWLATHAGQTWSRLGFTLPTEAMLSMISLARVILGTPRQMDRAA